MFMKRVAGKLAMKWQKPYSEVMGWVQVQMYVLCHTQSHGTMHLRNELEIDMEKWARNGDEVLDWPSSCNRLH